MEKIQQYGEKLNTHCYSINICFIILKSCWKFIKTKTF